MKIKLLFLIMNILVSLFATCQIDTSEFSFYRVYTQVLETRCAIPACHDGSFEPDFRTLESAYYTLVYHPVVKNNIGKSYTYRVWPGNVSASVLYKRISTCCFVNTNDRMPLTILEKGDTISPADMGLIKKWIESGAKDISGNQSKYSTAPIFIEPDYTSYIRDSICISTTENRVDKLSYNPFIIHTKDTHLKLEFKVSTSDYTRLMLLSNPQIQITDSLNGINTKVIKLKLHNSSFIADLKPSDFKADRTYYVQIEAMDEKTKSLISYPPFDASQGKRLSWAFFVKD